MKELAKILVVMGILLCIGGVFLGKLSDANKPKEIEVGYGAMIDGELVMIEEMETHTLVGSGNERNVKEAGTNSMLCYMLAGLCFGGSAVCMVKNR